MRVSAEDSNMGGEPHDINDHDPEVYNFHEIGVQIQINDYSYDILKEILWRTNELYEIEVHQLAFALDVFSIEEFGENLLGVRYTPDYHGVYSKDVSLALQKLADHDEIKAIADMFEGRSITKCDRLEPVHIDNDLSSIVDHVLSEVKEESDNTIGLINWSRNHHARNEAEFDEEIDLDEYLGDIRANNCNRAFPVPKNDKSSVPKKPRILFTGDDE